MLTKNKRRQTKRWKRITMATVATAGIAASATTSYGQDVGRAVLDAVGGNSASASVGSGAAAQSPLDRGINRAVQGALQGQSTRDAIRTGAREAVQSSVETPAQTFNRDQARLYGQQQNASQPTAPQPFTAQGQALQRDAQGRLFYRDASGRVTYPTSPVNGDDWQQPGWRQDSNFADYRSNANYGAQLAPANRGVRVQSIQQDSFAARSGLRPGDVILSVDGNSVQDRDALVRQMSRLDANESIQMRILRNGNEQTLTATTSSNFDQERQRSAKPSLDERSLMHEIEELRARVEEMQQEIDQLKRQRADSTPKN